MMIAEKNREIKFRAWIEDEMCYDIAEIEYQYFCIVVNDHSDDRAFDLEKAILMQYTGLKDKNGKEIYEGDVVKEVCYQAPGYSIGEAFSKVEFMDIRHSDTKGWGLTHVSGLDGVYLSFSNCEIVGNIYENPELLK